VVFLQGMKSVFNPVNQKEKKSLRPRAPSHPP
jgi:hypothetical protein